MKLRCRNDNELPITKGKFYQIEIIFKPFSCISSNHFHFELIQDDGGYSVTFDYGSRWFESFDFFMIDEINIFINIMEKELT